MPARTVRTGTTGNQGMRIRDSKLMRQSNIRIMAGLAALAALVAVLSGCAAPKRGPSVDPLPDGRQGFVIRENRKMDDAARADFGRAVAMMSAGNNVGAIELLKKVIYEAPTFTAPHIDIAMAYLRTGQTEPAEQHLKTVLSLVPGHPVASNEYGLLLRKAGHFTEAREVYEKAIASFPDYLPVHRNLGILCDLYLDDPACALEQFEIYGKGAPSDSQVKIWITELRMRLGR